MRSACACLFVIVLASCDSSESSPAPVASCPDAQLIVAASDFGGGGSVACHAPGCVEDERTTGLDLGGDPMLVRSSGRVFWLARDMDHIFELGPCAGPLRGGKTSFDAFRPATTNANPHDVAAASDGTLIVPLYNTPRLVFRKDGVSQDIDLAPFDDDGNPQAESVRVVDVGGVPKAFVALERLDDRSTPAFLATRPGMMLRVDVASRTVEATIELAGRNPFNPMKELGGALFLAEPGDVYAIGEAHAGIERFDTATSTTRLLAREQELGGSVMELAVRAGCGVAIATGPGTLNPTALVTFDPDTGAVLRSFSAPVLGPTPGFDLQGLAWDGDTLWVGDRRPVQNQYRVHELALSGTCELTDTGRSIPLPRAPVAFLPKQP